MSIKSKQTQKFVILFLTFIVPLLFFLFLASGKVNFTKLPTLTSKVQNIPVLASENEPISFSGKVSVVSFVGENPTIDDYQKILNLYQVIYKSNEKYKNFQLITFVPENTSGIVEKLNKELKKVGGVDLPKWKFVTLPSEKIQQLFTSFETPYVLKVEKGISKVFLVDEGVNLRGRTNDEDAKDGVLFGYETGSVAVLKNKLREDLNVVFYESKFAVQKPK